MIKKMFIKKALNLNDSQVEKLKLMVQDDKRSLFLAPDLYLDALLISHSLEKGMSLDNPKKNFGEDKVLALLECLKNIENKCFEYDVSMSIVDKYIKNHDGEGDKIDLIKRQYTELKKTKPYREVPSGVGYIIRTDLLTEKNIDFPAFLSSRHDIRKTTNEPIKESVIKRAIEIASLAPSACNRQPWKIFYSMKRENNAKLGEIVSGNKAFAGDMRYYCAIVLDHRFFANRPDEFRQVYLNAGIFLSYFVLALHSLDIGSCIMQFTGLVDDADRRSRELLGLKDSEQVMAVVGFGKYPDKIKYSKAGRRSVDEISVKY